MQQQRQGQRAQLQVTVGFHGGMHGSGWGLDGRKGLREGGNSCTWVFHCLSVSRAQLLPVESPEENVTSSSLTSSWPPLAATGIFLSWISPGGGPGQPEMGNESPKALCKTFPFPKEFKTPALLFQSDSPVECPAEG